MGLHQCALAYRYSVDTGVSSENGRSPLRKQPSKISLLMSTGSKCAVLWYSACVYDYDMPNNPGISQC